MTVAAAGRACYPAASPNAARKLAAGLERPLLVGELGGDVPSEFDLDNSPAALSRRTDVERPAVLLSSTGTRLFAEAAARTAVHAACLRNPTAQVRRLVTGGYQQVAVIGARSRVEFRDEDQLACARIAAGLVEAGYQPSGPTAELLARWRGVPVDVVADDASAAYLRRTGRLDDLDFILGHVDDLDRPSS